ncbi:hypothetical protein M406DRAFT_70507 [Cryphonectria parasitica EP155]|uniref:Hydrophobic surface binding protein n=1 Tax=Cryphonectria parasitica (strain ATCC 38755 / EP155) TaxID=660469 RepID=A0A9P4Y1W7_CRYP1|nr:uncharacterized protein M406DRAFT_70507 [Cryphonectria parasitica EP155]KAF3764984.1 hypothetical protein M406DRAFT_70507 [Cryphonectria parasitica EP155]
MMSLYAVATLAVAVSALPSIQKRDVTTVLDNLETIDSDTNTLTAAIEAWDASLLGALGVQSDVTTLETAVTDATSEAQTEAQADSADSTTILDYVSNTLNPDIIASLNALTAREADFAALSLDSLVLSDLQTLQSDTDDLGAALVAIASSDTEAEAETLVAAIDAAFASAIAVFS